MELIPDVYMVSSTTFGLGHFADCSVYLVDCGGELVLIDAGAGIDIRPLIEVVRSHGLDENNITRVVNTHCHFDHAGGDRKVHDACGCAIAIHANGADAIENADLVKISAPPTRQFDTVSVTTRLADNDMIRVGKYEFQVLHTPGHTDDSICLLMHHSAGKVLFSGDTAWALGQPGMMNVDFDFKAYQKSIQRLASLGVDILLPGHGLFVLSRGYEHLDLLLTRLSGQWSDIIVHPTHPFWPSVQMRQKLPGS